MEDNIKSNSTFSKSFLETFDSMIKNYNVSLESLNKIVNGSTQFDCLYGICNTCYKFRYIKPTDVSEFISNIVKGLKSELFSTWSDVEMFAVASVKKFLEQSGCIPFEASSLSGYGRRYIDPTQYTLHDLLMLCENESNNVSIYSNYELKERVKTVEEDCKALNDMHFTATMKNVVNALPKIINDICCNPIKLEIIKTAIEEFILFVCSLNSISVSSIIDYCEPHSDFTTQQEIQKDDVITEYNIIKTNEYHIKNGIPFNCNMRDIVLQDAHPNFKDTLSAIHFIMKDSRSPISLLVNKFKTSEIKDSDNLCDDVLNLFSGCIDHTDAGHCFNNNEYEKASFHTDVNWLDKIAYGNNYIDGNYRADTTGNSKVHPIYNSLDIIYKMYGGVNLTSNDELSDNICKITSIMKSFIRYYNMGRIENHELVRDILSTFGEIMTRNMLKLYYNNTRVVTYNDHMDDTMTPGYMYTESFVMEAEADDKPKVTLANDGNNAQQTTTQSKPGQPLMKIKDIIRKFITWISKKFRDVALKFSKDHKMEIDYVNKNKDLNSKISNELGSNFRVNLTNFHTYKIPAAELMKVKVKQVVDEWLKSDTPIDEKAIKKALYPQPVADQLISITDPAELSAALTNYILYSSIRPLPGFNGPLNKQIWEDICENITGSSTLIEKTNKAIADDMTRALEAISLKIPNNVNEQQEEKRNEQNQIEDRAQQLFNIIQGISSSYFTMSQNVLRSKFYRTNYDMYREIVTLYNRQQRTTKPAENNTTENKNNIMNDEAPSTDELTTPSPSTGEVK